MIQKSNNKKRILLIDDDKAITQTLSMLLETRGYDVNVANSGEEGFEKATAATDLILLDLILPDQEGFEVCRKLKEEERTCHIPIIILSAKLLSEDIVEGLYLGADDYLIKPFEYEELVARMEAVMRRKMVLNNGNIVAQGENAIIAELRKILDEKSIVSFFQPIFHLKPFKLFGFEVLSRPKTQSMLSNPELLFKAAIQFGCYTDLEMLSWTTALAYISKFVRNEKLFFNCNPYLIEGSNFQVVKSVFEKSHIDIKDTVLEITERSAISNTAIFYELVNNYRDHGFRFAVDDVGGGYASLESIVKIRPEIIKFDRHIISNLNKEPYKKGIIKSLVGFCKEHKVFSIAEGIETKEDLATVMELGVDAVQGYYLYKPTPEINRDDIEKVSSIILEANK